MKKLKVILLDYAKKNHWFMSFIRFIRSVRGKIKYLYLFFTNKVDDKMIIFEAYMGKQYACSPRAIYEEILKNEQYKDYKFVWFFKDVDKYKNMLKDDRTKIVKYSSKEYYKYYTKAKYWITNSRLNECIIKKKTQVYIQCWHGTPLKKLGYDIDVVGGNAMNSLKDIRKKYKDDSKRYSYMISPSAFCTEKFASAFDLKDKAIIKEVGYPRNDFLYKYTDKDVSRVKKELGIPKNKKVILYTPTWRDDQHESGIGYTYEVNIDFEKLRKELFNEYVILFRAHYFIANKIDLSEYEGFVYNVSDYDDINNLYIISDLLITDYSSVFFDYANLKRPIIFYMYDYDYYKGKLRDFYIDFKELPGEIVKKEKDLVKAIRKCEKFKYNKKYDNFNKKYTYLDDGNASSRVINSLIKTKKKVIPLIINIFKVVSVKNNNLRIRAFCLTKLTNRKKFDLEKINIILNGRNYNIDFVFSKGIGFIKGYKINFYNISIPIEDLLSMDIQNKIIVNYDNLYNGRIIYNVFDFFNGKNRNSKVLKINNNKSIYLRQTVKNTMYITVRETNVFDSFFGKFKIYNGWLLSKLLFKNSIILLFEKECSRYEESASVLYERLIDNGYKNVYYIVNKNNSRIVGIDDKYNKNLIYKNSLKHIVYFFKCKVFIGTESIGHSIQLRIANRLVINKINSKKIKYVFLQHGVMYMISLDSDLRTGFRKKDYLLHRIVVSSKEEADHFVMLGGFDYKDLYICGLPKFDKAIRNSESNKIVIMPTWRRWEVNQASEDYKETKYFKMIERIISGIPLKYRRNVIILPHPLMINSIKNNKDFNKYLPNEEFSYDEILKNCSLLITDYSSISYDAFYRGSNIIFYWEEKDECLEKYGVNAKLMLNEENAFGDVCYNEKELSKVVENNYMVEQKQKYIDKYRKIVEFYDNKNTDRLIEMLKDDKVI